MTTEGAQLSAAGCRDYFDALTDVGFTPEQATQIVAAWQSRPQGFDAATMNAIMQNFAASVTGRE